MAPPLPLSPVRGLLLLLGSASRANCRELGRWLGAVGPRGGRAGGAGARGAYGGPAETVLLAIWGAEWFLGRKAVAERWGKSCEPDPLSRPKNHYAPTCTMHRPAARQRRPARTLPRPCRREAEPSNSNKPRTAEGGNEPAM